MAEYIERDALFTKFYCESVEVDGKLYLLYQGVAEFLHNIPTADVAPVVHGRWIDVTCTNCGQVDFSKPNYCPNCGAKMDLEET